MGVRFLILTRRVLFYAPLKKKMYLVTFCSTHSLCEVSGDSIGFFVCLFVVAIKDSWGNALIICQAWRV